MRLPKDLLSGNYIKPRIFLCEVDKERICQLETTNTSAALKFNSYSELSFEVGRTYSNLTTGETEINPYYDKIEAIRLIELENLGYFEIQGPEITGDGIKEAKNITAYSLEYTLSQKYLENFIVNTGEVDSIEVIYATNVVGDSNTITPVVFYNPDNKELSLLHLALESVYGWKIAHVDDSLKTLSRQFDVDRESVYDFLMNEVCEKFNCYIVFDTIDNTISVYAESLTSKFIGDGTTNTFVISPPFAEVGTVSVDGYKVSNLNYSYDRNTGKLTLANTPGSGVHIEVIDGALEAWETDVFVSFDNLAQEINISYDADAIKTKLTVTYGDDGNIREVNLGSPYLTDLSYFYTVDWMGQELYDAYTAYIQKSNNLQIEYTNNSQEILKLNDQIFYEENRLSLEYSLVQSVNSTTVGKYYIRKENSDGSFYYTEVSLPQDYNANETYYSNATTNVNEEKVSAFYAVLKKYFNNENEDDPNADANVTSWKTDMEQLRDQFVFLEHFTFDKLLKTMESVATDRIGDRDVEMYLHGFLIELWSELGRTPLKKLYLEPYQTIKDTNMSDGWADMNHANHAYYYPVLLMIGSLELTIGERDVVIGDLEKQRSDFYSLNANISDELLMNDNFTEKQLIRLNAFLREDELHLEDIVETSQDDLTSSFKIKQDAMESGRIELQKLCQPQLQFSMSMANIYALPEFEPIIDQFQLGNVIKVSLRPDYIKQSRLLQVDINFDNFDDFSCEFGELTSLRTQSDIHADLLKNAITAGKSVATYSGKWTKGSDTVTDIELKLQKGLLDATQKICAMDGNQGVVIDKYGIWLKKLNDDGSTSQYQTRIVNNMILMSDDGFKTSKSALGEVVVDGETYYGLITEMVLSGRVETSIINSSEIKGGTIQIGPQKDENDTVVSYAFEVREDGSVTMNAGDIVGYAKEEYVQQKIQEVNTTIISDAEPSDAQEGLLWLNTSVNPYQLMVFTDGAWEVFNQQEGEVIYITKPESYNKGDLWIVSDDDAYNMCRIVDGQTTELLQSLWDNTDDTVTFFTKDGLLISKVAYERHEVVSGEGEANQYKIYTSMDVLSDPAIIYCEGFFSSGYGGQDSIVIYDSNNEEICSQSEITYYGTDEVAQKTSEEQNLYLIYSNGQIYLAAEGSDNTFFCREQIGVKLVNGTLLKAIESSSTFNYDHWVDISLKNTQMQNGIYQNFTFDKESGLRIGQTDNKFYVNIDSQEMGFYSKDDNGEDTKVVHIGDKSAGIQNATFDGSDGTTFNNNVTFNAEVKALGLTFKKELNNSWSLVI